jgi:hypothetical protein
MTPLEITLIIICLFLLILVCVSFYFNLKLGKLILDLQDSIERSLDLLDEKYISMSKVLEKPVFFDSLEVRQVVSDIKDCRDTVLLIANTLTSSFKKDN